MLSISMEQSILINLLSFIWFFCLWIGYVWFARKMAKKRQSLSSILHVHRMNWMRRLLKRLIRMTDAALIANLERNVNFFASSCVLILAGLLTSLSVSEEIRGMLNQVSFIQPVSLISVEIKIATLICIFIYGFFTFTWSMRQFGFASVLIGAAPMPEENDVTPAERRSFVIYAAKVIDMASHSYNNGLRSFYFAMAVLSWFIGAGYFIFSSTLVILVLYHREFKSKSLKALSEVEMAEQTRSKSDDDLYQRKNKK